jgi:hypothetical protein
MQNVHVLVRVSAAPNLDGGEIAPQLASVVPQPTDSLLLNLAYALTADI